MPAQPGDNSLPDLAARIRAAHQAVGEAMKHAIAAGELLAEAKSKVPHGDWLLWLEANCEMSERTAQGYMRIARELARLEPAKAQRVADLSVRDALRSLSRATGAARLSPEGLESVLEKAEANSHMPLDHAIRNMRRHELLNSLATPGSMTPPSSPAGRTLRVAHNATSRQWLLAIGPNAAGLTLKQDLAAADEDAAIIALRQEHGELVEEADRLEAEAKAMREAARDFERLIGREKAALVRARKGPAYPMIETYDFLADQATDRELEAGPPEKTRARLLAARGQGVGPLKEIARGYWGDLNAMGDCDLAPGPSADVSGADRGGVRPGWTGVGSPEWLDELFKPRGPSS